MHMRREGLVSLLTRSSVHFIMEAILRLRRCVPKSTPKHFSLNCIIISIIIRHDIVKAPFKVGNLYNENSIRLNDESGTRTYVQCLGDYEAICR